MKKLWIIIKHGEIPWKFFMTLIPPTYLFVYSLCHFFHFYCVIFPHLSLFFRSWEFAFAPSPVSHKCWIWGGSRRGEVGGSQRPCVMTYSFHLRPLLTWRLVLCLLNYTMRSLLCSIVIIYHSDIVIYMCVPNTQIVHIFSTTFTIIIVIIISDQ